VKISSRLGLAYFIAITIGGLAPACAQIKPASNSLRADDGRNERRTFRNFVSVRRNYLPLSQTYWLAVDRESGDADRRDLVRFIAWALRCSAQRTTLMSAG